MTMKGLVTRKMTGTRKVTDGGTTCRAEFRKRTKTRTLKDIVTRAVTTLGLNKNDRPNSQTG